MKRVLVLKAPGTNNEVETVEAVKMQNCFAEIVHISELLNKEKKLNDYHGLIIPGGFSYGDNIGAGKVLSFYIEKRLKEEFIKFIEKGKMILGICNGFQALIKSKILPEITEKQVATLTLNNCGHFVCKWVKLKVLKHPIFKNLPDEIELPVAHAEGRFVVEKNFKRNIDRYKILLYIENPNGSYKNIAGITNESKNVIGIMPHPERCLFPFQNPSSRYNGKIFPWGKIIFKNFVSLL
ncbi:MAG: phosphoribosylformylglycinamidine synthase [Caldiserica bacterium]|nr:MAG: phosphoribosylformylglycinamidine synthase [Caldisericota bacterium]